MSPVISRCLLLLLLLLPLAGSADAQPALRARLLVAEDQRAASADDLNALRQGLASRDVATRRQAVRAIGRLERPDLMPLISRFLTDPNADVRIETVNAIGQMARGVEGVAAAKGRLLVRIRGEQTPRVKGVVAATLGRLAFTTADDVQEAERAIAALVPLAASLANLDEIAGAVEGLEALIRQSGKISPPSPDTIARLRGAAKIEGRQQDTAVLVRIRRLATAALTAAGRIDRDFLDRGSADPDDEVRRLTMVAARADVENREAVLRRGLSDAEARVRYEALQTWGRTLQKQTCAPVVTALGDTNPHVTLLAIDLLGNGCPEPTTVESLRARAQTLSPSATGWHVPAHAIVSLARVAPAEAGKLLPPFVSHPAWQVRMYAAHAAGRAGAFDAVVKLAGDVHDNVREAALSELITARRPESIAVAVEALSRPDYQLIITAARALADAPDNTRAVSALTAALVRIDNDQRDTARDARTAIVERLQQLGAPSTLPPPAPLPHPPARWADVQQLRGAQLRFVMSGRGSFTIKLLTDEAPLSSLRVATRAREGYYNGLTFHRVVPNFVIQGGSPGANEYAGDAAFMRDEVGLVSHRRGTVGISTRGRDTGDAQIFVNLVDLPRLDHTYTVMGEVIAGMDVVDRILEGDVIERVEIVRQGS